MRARAHSVCAIRQQSVLMVGFVQKKYETKLHNERDATLRLKGENGIMQKKFKALTKDIEDLKDNIGVRRTLMAFDPCI